MTDQLDHDLSVNYVYITNLNCNYHVTEHRDYDAEVFGYMIDDCIHRHTLAMTLHTVRCISRVSNSLNTSSVNSRLSVSMAVYFHTVCGSLLADSVLWFYRRYVSSSPTMISLKALPGSRNCTMSDILYHRKCSE